VGPLYRKEKKSRSVRNKKLIILHIFNNGVFVEAGLLLIEQNRSREHQEDKNGEVFPDWFRENSVKIIFRQLRNDSHHSVKIRRPTKY
jgi:molybdopterin biosynthesis enzyme MoaB